jgi:predicted protein tyrosine phosphatase
MTIRHVLFICSRNQLRSPTAEQVFLAWPGIEVASAGLDPAAEVPVTPELLQWANLIFVMETVHRKKLSAKFGAHLNRQRIICLDIPDNYEYMEPALMELLKKRVAPHLPMTAASEKGTK